MSMPQISVILPVFNGERFLREAIQSVLCQQFRDFELIVVDDGSTDSSPAILQEFPGIRVIAQKNAGQSAARNRGIAASSGELIALIDQDDRWYPTKLSRQVEALTASSHIGMHYSDIDAIDVHGQIDTHRLLATHGMKHPKHSLLDCVEQDMLIVPTTVMFRREVFEKTGGFDERLSGYEDDDLFIRMFPIARFEFCSESLAQWRLYPESSSHSERMDESRKIYIRKLLELLPDDPIKGIHYKRDFIVPRFARTYIHMYRQAKERSDHLKMERMKDDLLNFLGPLMTRKGRSRAWLMTQEGPAFDLIRRVGDFMPLSLRRLAGGG
jgi:glycosyltransferase involved in cell wall biosynthesis